MDQDKLLEQDNTNFFISVPGRQLQFYSEKLAKVTANLRRE